jgi:ATP-dependent DNA ligase
MSGEPLLSPESPLSPRAFVRYLVDVFRVQFIPPALPRLRASPPAGEAWLFELKFDGWRVQLHKAGVSSMLYGRNRRDLTHRFLRIAAAVLGLPTRSCVIERTDCRRPSRPTLPRFQGMSCSFDGPRRDTQRSSATSASARSSRLRRHVGCRMPC